MNLAMLNFLKRVIVLVVVFCALRYLGDFPEKQSIVLAVIVMLLYREVIPLSDQPKFVPYRVFVRPDVHAIVTDLELVKGTEESWAELRAEIEKLPKQPCDVWSSGFSFSFITPELIYDNGWNSFSADEVNLSASLEPIGLAFSETGRDFGFGPFRPRLDLQAGREFGCILKITLPVWYWEKMKTKESFKGTGKQDVSVDHSCGTVDVVLARIPPQEFGIYEAMRGGYSEEKISKAVTIRTEARLRFGWKGKSYQDMYGNEPGDERSDTAQHKYCDVSHNAI
jgi:hypothetical protein